PCSLSLSFLLRPPPTTSPPFPYTTLFRSAAQGTRTLDLAVVGEQGRRTRHCRSCQRQHNRARAQKNTLQPHRRQHWVIPPTANSAFVAAMEDVLAVYTRPRDGDCPLVCLDE